MKTCKKCLQEKEETEFFKKRENSLEGTCKVCKKERVLELKNADPEKYKEKERKRSEERRSTEEWKAWRKDHQARNREQIREKAREYYRENKPLQEKYKVWRSENRDRVNASINKHKERFPVKAACRSYVHAALKQGLLLRPENCSKCMKVCIPEAHHQDYAKPLEVTWLCRSCHGREHRK